MITASITAFFEMIKQWFCTKEKSLEQISTSTVVQNRNSLKKATNIAEEILNLTDKYVHLFDEKDSKTYGRLKRRFQRYS